MADIPEASVKLTLDTSEWDASYKQILSDAANLEKILSDLGASVSLTVNVDSSEVTAVASIVDSLGADDPTVTVSVDDAEIVTAAGDIDDIDSEAPSVSVSVDDSEVTTVAADIDDIDSEAPSVTVNVEDAEITEASNKLALLTRKGANIVKRIVVSDADIVNAKESVKGLADGLKSLSLINIAFAIPKIGADVIGFIRELPILQSFMESDAASRIVDVAVPDGIEGADTIIGNLYTNSQASREEIARLIAELSNMGVADSQIQDTAQGLLDTQLAIEGITGEAPDMETLIARASDLKSLGLADTWQDAFDVMVSGFQSGISIGGDFLGDLGEFAPTFATMGFTAEQMLNTLSTGLNGGVDNISRMSEGLISFNENASTAKDTFIAAIDTIDESTGSDLAGNLELYQAGQLTGADFMASVLDAARAYAETNGTAAAQGILGDIFGGTASNIGAQALLSIDPNADEFTDLENRAADAATIMQDSLVNAITEFQRVVEQTAVDFMSSEQIDLPGKIEAIKTGLQDAVAVLQAGGTIGEALDVGFHIEGVDEFISKFQSVVGNLVIAFLDIVADIQDFLGKDSSGTRGEIARLGQQQLEFDLQIATDPAEIAALVTAAQGRGVTSETIGQTVQDTISQLLDSGQLGQAQDVIAGTQRQSAHITTGFGGDFNTVQGADETFEEFQARLEHLFSTQYGKTGYQITFSPSVDLGDAEADVSAAAETLQTDLTNAMASGDLLGAIDIAGELGDQAMLDQLTGIAQQYRDAFAAALASGDVEGAAMYASYLPGDEEIAALAQNSADVLKAGFDTAVAENDTETATNIANLLNDTDLQTRAAELATTITTVKDSVRANAKDMGDAMDTLDKTTSDAISGNTMTVEFETLKASAEENIIPVIDFVNALSEAFISANGSATAFTSSATAGLTGLSAAATGAQSGVGTGLAGVEPNFHGGQFEAGDKLLFEGSREIVSFTQPGEVIGARETAGMMGAGGGNVTNTNVYNTINVNQNVASMAQAAASGNEISKAARNIA